MEKKLNYLTAFILFCVGLLLIILTAAKGISDPDLKHHGYLIGGIILGSGVLLSFLIYTWSRYEKTKKLIK